MKRTPADDVLRAPGLRVRRRGRYIEIDRHRTPEQQARLLAKLVNGEGILGLTRAFFYAGARNVTVSLWNVNDSATATLMKSFYGNLNRGLPQSAALRQAKLSLLHGENLIWRHAYFWASFVLVGEGK
ncbi:MAG TPA: CHAT domain-containing protein [Candidatus Acidoferrum sp.]|nr:CHAT domain-containing protein [Candidatus Acidoferrum sp.]